MSLNSPSKIARQIVEAAQSTATVSTIKNMVTSPKENELVFFFKPEVFLSEAKSEQLIDATLSTFARYEIDISGVVTVSGAALEKHAIMDTHYGYINRMSRLASRELTSQDLSNIRTSLSLESKTQVLGGHEVLARFPEYTAKSLDDLWASKRSLKIKSGLYAQCFQIDSDILAIINGFHPEQLAHFTKPERRIALMVLHSNLPWRFLRTRVLGDTFPEKALPDTLRRTYYEHATDFGLADVSIANNCVHMSAGPFEAALELENFFGRLGEAAYSGTRSNIRRRLESIPDGFSRAVSNPSTTLNGGQVSLFDATEEIDATGAVEIFHRVYL